MWKRSISYSHSGAGNRPRLHLSLFPQHPTPFLPPPSFLPSIPLLLRVFFLSSLCEVAAWRGLGERERGNVKWGFSDGAEGPWLRSPHGWRPGSSCRLCVWLWLKWWVHEGNFSRSLWKRGQMDPQHLKRFSRFSCLHNLDVTDLDTLKSFKVLKSGLFYMD